VAKRRKGVFQLLNESALFWSTVARALQESAIVAVGRVFDQHSAHNIDVVLRLAQDNPLIFSKASLGRRRQGNLSVQPLWLVDFLRNVHEPSPAEFRRLRRDIKRWRKIFDKNYRPLRHKLFAHSDISDQAEMGTIIANTSVRELERLLLFLLSICESLRHLFMEGRKPTLRQPRPSVNRMGRLRLPRTAIRGVHERMVHQAEQTLMRAARPDAGRHHDTIGRE
jgi:hypothetical protein